MAVLLIHVVHIAVTEVLFTQQQSKLRPFIFNMLYMQYVEIWTLFNMEQFGAAINNRNEVSRTHMLLVSCQILLCRKDVGKIHSSGEHWPK